jgi:hypothetical protein
MSPSTELHFLTDCFFFNLLRVTLQSDISENPDLPYFLKVIGIECKRQNQNYSHWNEIRSEMNYKRNEDKLKQPKTESLMGNISKYNIS